METSIRIKLLLVLGLTLLLSFLAGSLTGCDSWRGPTDNLWRAPTDNQTRGGLAPPGTPSFCGGVQDSLCGSFVPSLGGEPPPPATKGSPPKPPELIDGTQLPSDTQGIGGTGGGRGSSGGGRK